MKIALLLSGQARKLLQGHQYIKKNILDCYDVDVYCQLWWDDHVKRNGYISKNKVFKVETELPQLVQKIYNPKKISIDESPFNYTSNNLHQSVFFEIYPQYKNKFWTFIESDLSHFFALKKVSQLLNWDEYDFIIKTRYDINILKFPDLNILDKTKFYPGQDWHGTLLNQKNMFCDWVFIFPNDMQKFTLIIDNLDDTNIYQYGSHPEAIYAKYLELCDFSNKLFKLPCDDFCYTTI